jgi:DNA polymerase I
MKILIVDGNATAHRAKHVTGEMKYSGEYTGVIYGFFTQLLTMLKKYKPDYIAFAWDSKTSIRKEIFPEYKAKRTKAKQEKTKAEQAFDKACYAQFYEIQEDILPAIGFKNNFRIKGFEGDDLIASICLNNVGKKIIATSDNDMFQLLNDEVTIYDLRNKKDFTAENFRDVYKITADKWAEVKALAGCDSDEVPGIQGVGIQTAIKYTQGLINHKYLTYKKITEDTHIRERNRKLVTLPLKGTPVIKLAKQDQYDFQKMKTIFMDYGFRSLCGEKFNEWKTLLGGKS